MSGLMHKEDPLRTDLSSLNPLDHNHKLNSQDNHAPRNREIHSLEMETSCQTSLVISRPFPGKMAGLKCKVKVRKIKINREVSRNNHSQDSDKTSSHRVNNKKYLTNTSDHSASHRCLMINLSRIWHQALIHLTHKNSE